MLKSSSLRVTDGECEWARGGAGFGGVREQLGLGMVGRKVQRPNTPAGMCAGRAWLAGVVPWKVQCIIQCADPSWMEGSGLSGCLRTQQALRNGRKAPANILPNWKAQRKLTHTNEPAIGEKPLASLRSKWQVQPAAQAHHRGRLYSFFMLHQANNSSDKDVAPCHPQAVGIPRYLEATPLLKNESLPPICNKCAIQCKGPHATRRTACLPNSRAASNDAI